MSRPLTIVLLGRPNVGKSALFNRLLGRKKSLVHDLPGVTRDRIIADTAWDMKEGSVAIRLIDTGGIGGKNFDAEIRRQVEIAFEEADVALLVLDSQTGPTNEDLEVLRWIRSAGLERKARLLAIANKVDDSMHEERANDFYELGFTEIIGVSAEHGRGIPVLRERILEEAGSRAKKAVEPVEGEPDLPEPERDRTPRIAIVGKPNAGKSTLLNALLGQERAIVSPIAGTTVDPVDTPAFIGKLPVVLVDTAGIRKKSKTKQGVEVLSIVQARKQLEQADLALLVLDASEGASDQDEKIAGLVEEMGASVVVLLNKWDLLGEKVTRKDAEKKLRHSMPFLSYATVLYISGLKKKGLNTLEREIRGVLEDRKVRITAKELTDWLKGELNISNPDSVKLFYAHMAGSRPPTFILHVNDPRKMHFSLRRKIVNRLRGRWGFRGSPVRLVVQSRAKQ